MGALDSSLGLAYPLIPEGGCTRVNWETASQAQRNLPPSFPARLALGFLSG